ncbi:unnamed protein product, partial [Prorocentrum cordatum]
AFGFDHTPRDGGLDHRGLDDTRSGQGATPTGGEFEQQDLSAVGLQAQRLSGIGLASLPASSLQSLPADPATSDADGALCIGELDRRLQAAFNETKNDEELLAKQRAFHAMGSGVADPNKKKKVDKVLEDAWAAGACPARGAIGARFSTFLDACAEKKKEYKSMKGNSAKEEFRMDWLAKEHAKYAKKRSVTERLEESWQDWGTYEPFEVIAGKESGTGVTVSGAKAALNICSSCIKLGGAWIRWNNQSKRLEFLYMKKVYSYKFDKAWQQWEELVDVGDQKTLGTAPAAALPGGLPAEAAPASLPAAPAAASSAPAAASSAPAAASSAPAAQAGAPPAAQREAEASARPEARAAQPRSGAASSVPSRAASPAKDGTAAAVPSKRRRGQGEQQAPPADGESPSVTDEKELKRIKQKELKANTDAAMKALGEYGQICNHAMLLINAIENQPEYSWANNQNKDGLKRALEEVQATASPGTFVKDLLMQNVTHVKRMRGAEYFEKEIGCVAPKIAEPLKRPRAEIESIDDMHAVKLRKTSYSN